MKLIRILLATVVVVATSFADQPKIEKKIPAFMKMDDFKLKTIDGKSVKMLSQKRGYLFEKAKGKLSIMVIWSGGSKDSKKWLTQMQELQNSNPNKIYVSALEIDNMPKKSMLEFAKKNNLTFPMYSAAENKDFASQAIVKYQFLKKDKTSGKRGGVPYSIIFDYKGDTIHMTRGVVKQGEFKDYTSKLIDVLEKEKTDKNKKGKDKK